MPANSNCSAYAQRLIGYSEIRNGSPRCGRRYGAASGCSISILARIAGLREVQVLEMRHSNVVVLDAEVPVRLLIDYAALNLDGADVAIRERAARGLGRQEVAVGDVVGFQDRDGRQRCGAVQRLNTKTVTLDCDGQAWRVSYALLHRMINSEP